jgi:hypothetical protein
MKASEVRLGNLVYGVSDRIETVIGIGENSITAYAGKLIKAKMKFPEKDFRPIPLTEEWLVKFGFDSDGFKQYEFMNWGLFVKKGMGKGYAASHGFFVQRFELTEINFVHELQNLFYALSQEELKIAE